MSPKLKSIINHFNQNKDFVKMNNQNKTMMLYLLQVWHIFYFSKPAFSDVFFIKDGHLSINTDLNQNDVSPESFSLDTKFTFFINEIERRFSKVPLNALIMDLQGYDPIWKTISKEGRDSITVFDFKRILSYDFKNDKIIEKN